MSSIKVFKLTNGDELISRASEEPNGWELTNPWTINVIQDQTGRPMAGLAPFFMSSKDSRFTLRKEHVVGVIDAPSDVEAGYIKQASGIEIQPAGKIVV